jgi:hypothetical protein
VFAHCNSELARAKWANVKAALAVGFKSLSRPINFIELRGDLFKAIGKPNKILSLPLWAPVSAVCAEIAFNNPDVSD